MQNTNDEEIQQILKDVNENIQDEYMNKDKNDHYNKSYNMDER